MLRERMNDYAVLTMQVMPQMVRCWEARIFAESAINNGISPTLRYLSGKIETEKELKDQGLPIIISLCEANKSLETILEFELHREPGKIRLLQEECHELISLFLKRTNGSKL